MLWGQDFIVRRSDPSNDPLPAAGERIVAFARPGKPPTDRFRHHQNRRFRPEFR
jgi:hypothetical protein